MHLFRAVLDIIQMANVNNVNVVWVSCTWTEQSTCQLKARLLVLHLIPVVQYIADNQPFDCTIFVWRS